MDCQRVQDWLLQAEDPRPERCPGEVADHLRRCPATLEQPRPLRMQRALIDGTADAARNARPAYADAIIAWHQARLRQALRGRLAITIGHRDILVLPPGG